MPERLQAHGISWKIYDTPPTGISTQVSNNVMPLFKQYQDPSSELYRRAMLPSWPIEFEADCLAGTLPQVSWVLAPPGFDEHPPAPSGFGEFVAARVLSALTSNPALWSKTALFITYDEQGGFFDHVTPPTPPPGTPEEYLHGVPIGLGYRVPMLVVSPFSRGGYVCSEVFDHTSMLRLLERRFGVEVPNLSAWRRSAVGDLTHTLGPGFDASQPVPAPTTLPPVPAVLEAPFVFPSELDGTPTPPYPVPAAQQMPTQEPGRRKRRPAA
jgi:phospholipase C